MSDTNLQIEAQLDALAEICCEALSGDGTGLANRSDPLLKSLLMSGYVRKTGLSLAVDIESRVKDRCREVAMHRGGALSGITQNLQKSLDKLVRWESEQPKDVSPPKAANISSATDA